MYERGADQGAVLRQPRVVDGAGQAEVGDLDPRQLVLEHDVRRLDVAVDQALRVGGGQARGDLHADPQQLLQLERAALVDPLLEREPGDEFHDQEGPAAPLADGVDGDDVRVGDGRGRLRLAGEPPPRGLIGRPLRRQRLDRHVSVQRRVVPLVDDPHRPLADPVDHLVRAEPAEVVGHLGGREPVGVRLVVGRPHQVAQGRRDLLDRVAVGEEVAQLVEELGVAGQPSPAVGLRGRRGLLEELGDHPVEPLLAVGRVGRALEHRLASLRDVPGHMLAEGLDPAPEEPGDRRVAPAEPGADLGHRAAVQVVQLDGLALVVGQGVEGLGQRQELLVADRLLAGRAVVVGEPGLEPGRRLIEPGQERPLQVGVALAAAVPAGLVGHRPGEDLPEPGGQRRLPGDRASPGRLVRLEQRELHQV